jgi:hypothetical protein
MRRAVLCLAFLLTACAQSRAEERAISHALSLGFVAPAADCDGERKDLPDHLICDVQEGDPEAAQRGVRLACPSGLADGSCFEPGNAGGGVFGKSGGAL